MTKLIPTCLFGLGLLAATAGAAHADALRPAVGKPLQDARAAMARGNYAAASAKIRSAEAVPGRTADENFVILQMHAAVAMGSKDYPAAQRYYQELLNSGRLSAGEQNKVLMALASISYSQKNYPAAISWIQKLQRAGGGTAEMNALLIQSYYQAGDFQNAAHLQANAINAAMRNGRAPSEGDLQLLYACHDALKNTAAAQTTMQLLVTYYPKPEYWAHLIHAVETNPRFADRLKLDLMRFKLAAGLMTETDDYFETVLLALQEPLPGEAKAIIDEAYAKGIFGTGPGAPRQQRLRDKVAATAAEVAKTLAADEAAAHGDRDGNRLVSLGGIYVADGKLDQGIALIKEGMAKDKLSQPEDAKLHLALAYLKAGDKAQAVAMLKTVGGNDGAADIAKLWLLKTR